MIIFLPGRRGLHDFSQPCKDEKLGGSFDRLRQAFTEITDNFRKIRMEKEEHYQYLQIIVQKAMDLHRGSISVHSPGRRKKRF